MKCPNCNYSTNESLKFCPECGTKLNDDTPQVEVENKEVEVTEAEIAKKNQKKKKIKRFIILGAIVLVFGIAFLVFYLINPFCWFGHSMENTICGENVAPTCTEYGYTKVYCEYCSYTDTWFNNERPTDHTWGKVVCGTEGTCLTCGEKKSFSHSVGYEGKCENCGQLRYTIKLPSTPVTVHEFDYSGNTEQSVRITNFEFSMFSTSSDVYITCTLKKTYDENGNNHSSSGKFAWKLYDSKGKVLDSGTEYSSANSVGEESEATIKLYGHDLDNWITYRLEILNVS